MFKLSIKTPKRRQWRLSVNVIWECFAHMEEIETSQLNLHWRSIFMSLWAERWFWKIVHKKDRQVIHWVTTSGTSVNEWQRVTNNKWYDEWQRVVKRETTSDKKWQRMTTSENEWSFWLIFFFFRIGEEPTTTHPKETL